MTKRTIIHVNRQMIAANRKRSADNLLPVYTIKSGKTNTYGYAVNILGPSHLIDVRSANQLSCGATAWIETDSPVEVTGAMTFTELKLLKEKND